MTIGATGQSVKPDRYRQTLILALGLLAGMVLADTTADAQEMLPILARVGPWPVASSPIGFAGRVWFVNSVKGRNHNSADLYSYDPQTGAVRYERHLFSQDGGRPMVAGGRLFLPFEDARFSLGWGHFLVTDGTRWELGTIPNGQIFHTHAMTSLGDRLLAATSAWRAGLQISDDGGVTWTQIYDHPTPERRVSRIVELAVVDDLVLGYLIQGDQRRLLRFDGTGVADVPGWPRDRSVLGMATHDDAVFAIVREAGGIAVWRTDGFSGRRVADPRQDWRLRDIVADERGLWAVGGGPDGGTVWHSADGIDWNPIWQVGGGEPLELTVYAGNIFVAGMASDGGVLWGPSPPAGTEAAEYPTWPAMHRSEPDPSSVAALDLLLKDADSYSGQAGLRDAIYALAGTEGSGTVFAERLMGEAPPRPVGLIGGRVRISSTTLRRWLLLWGMTLAGEGRVPPELIAEPWTVPQNSSEKYFSSPPAAMRAVAAIGQNDTATIEALIERLGREEDPLWLRGDAVGALADLTGQRLAYDFDAWREWWAEAKANWPP